MADDHRIIISSPEAEIPREEMLQDTADMGATTSVSIKDFAYATTDPLHYGVTTEMGLEFDDYNDYNENDEEYLTEDYETMPSWVKDDQEDDIPGEDRLRRAIALYPFSPENENELELEEHQVIMINYKYGDGWLVASDLETGDTGLVPEEYVQLLEEEEEEEEEEARPFLPSILQDSGGVDADDDDEWEDEEDEEDDEELSEATDNLQKLRVGEK
ncbi:unnamed protein product [Kuraishia capsulata CBS 1993]|uniref:SH3 domain-containing protein n=1 Tax=Kuraishia capsulata CBS 1993 TaxID=1382522 RepID=W6MHN7_9ASCO|nr:uncharacterized protein KUCA_T00001255001 [Kuraishia capsulata CBS 1993]CDK25288.1 unnamed protein product [Kuraishia capsulata CBS 1993]